MTSQTIGFSVSCFRGDLPLARATLSSIRAFASDAPISLIVDGDCCPTRALEKTYGVTVIRKGDVKNRDLRKWSFGYGLTKMIALWEAPFDIIFHVDADAILWGDIRENLPSGRWDLVYNEPHEVITEQVQLAQYFDPDLIFKYIEPFQWKNNQYFNGGAFCVRKGILDLDEYMRLLEIQRNHPGVISSGEQGHLGILVFRAVQEGSIIAKRACLQALVPMIPKDDLEKRFRIVNGTPIVDGMPAIIHWAGEKPWRENKEIFRAPMDYFRERALRECGVPGQLPIGIVTHVDEFVSRRWPIIAADTKRRVKSLLGMKGSSVRKS